jgi:hypothetical protein
MRVEALRRRPELTGLVALLALGVLLRLWLTLEWRPAITGYSDSGIYFQNGVEGLFTDPFRTVGYSAFLDALHWVTPHLLPVIVLQHAMGLATGVVLYLTVRRVGGPPWLGLVPAAVVILGGTQIFLEHSALTEALFTLILATMLYAAVRAARGALAWAMAAGLCAGLGVTIREAGAILIPPLAGWLLLSARRPTRESAVRAGAALAVALAIVSGYLAWRHEETGLRGLTTNGPWNLYGRVAPWADCTKFDPPRGTEVLCDPRAPSLRGGQGYAYYIFSPQAPAQRALGPPYLVSPDRDGPKKLRRFSIAAIEGQPLDYLHAVGDDALRLAVPGHHSYGDLSGDGLIGFLLGGPDGTSGRNDFVDYWQRRYYPGDTVHRSELTALKRYESWTRIEGAPMVLLLLLALAAPWAVRGEARAGARLLALVGLMLVVVPILGKGFDYRFMVPPHGVLAAAGALAGWGIAQRVRERRAAA